MAAFVSRYAHAFLDVVTAVHLDTAALDKQLADFEATWDGSAELQTFFQNPAVGAVQKVGILDKLNARMGMQKELRNLIAVLINHDRIGSVHEVAAAYRAALQERMGVRQAEIVTARELSGDERAQLLDGVGKLAGAKIEANFKLDQSILGGAVVRIGSTVYDGSVRGRLQRLKEALTG
ncbi:MAG TPA: ATP synthase F1 subunit delta [Terracidiphilus sp.]|jgi:F-type H+-transporting ATPase subunit delta|nr:ATP synthase F1 subunit delta [Terracidiphilus sp.]